MQYRIQSPTYLWPARSASAVVYDIRLFTMPSGHPIRFRASSVADAQDERDHACSSSTGSFEALD